MPPRLNGETTSIGTRKPRPIGPAIPSASAGSGATVTYSPAVPGGRYRRRHVVEEAVVLVVHVNSTVLDHTSGLDTSVSSTWLVYHSPSGGRRRTGARRSRRAG